MFHHEFFWKINLRCSNFHQLVLDHELPILAHELPPLDDGPSTAPMGVLVAAGVPPGGVVSWGIVLLKLKNVMGYPSCFSLNNNDQWAMKYLMIDKPVRKKWNGTVLGWASLLLSISSSSSLVSVMSLSEDTTRPGWSVLSSSDIRPGGGSMSEKGCGAYAEASTRMAIIPSF